jgi:hypothetical protein
VLTVGHGQTEFAGDAGELAGAGVWNYGDFEMWGATFMTPVWCIEKLPVRPLGLPVTRSMAT